MNILIKPEKTDIVIPIMNIIMPNKSYSSYMYIFNDLKLILFLNKITVDWKKIVIVTDFEKGLIKAIEISFLNLNILVAITIIANVFGFMQEIICVIIKKLKMK